MSTIQTDEFLRSLPPTPLHGHIGQIHAILLYVRVVGHDPNALQIAEHSLREIARFTSAEDWVRDGIRREVLDEFTTALKMVTAEDPTRSTT